VRRILGFLVVVGLLVAAVVLLDGWARGRVEQRIVDEVGAQVPGLTGLDATVHGTPVLTQLAARRLADVRLTADGAELDAVTLADVTARATGVTTTAPASAERVEVTALLPLDQVAALVQQSADADVTVDADAVVLTLRTLPITARVVPTATGDAITLDVTEVGIAGATVAPEDLPLGLGDGLTGLAVPVAGLPAGIALTAVAVTPDGLRLTATGDDVTLAAP
jgi:hypothetical protein